MGWSAPSSGLQNMRIQAFLTAAAVDLKRLAAALGVPLSALARLVSAALREPWVKRGKPLGEPVALGAHAV